MPSTQIMIQEPKSTHIKYCKTKLPLIQETLKNSNSMIRVDQTLREQKIKLITENEKLKIKT